MLSSGIKSPWDSDPRNPDDDDDAYGSGQDQIWLGQILERSTSAPPPASETKLESGDTRHEDDGESFLFGRARQRMSSPRFGLFEDSGRDTSPMTSTTDGGAFFLDYDEKTGRSTAPGIYGSTAFEEPLFSDRARGQSNASNELRFNVDDGRRVYAFDRPVGGEGLVRSQSAAPILVPRSSLGPPPGLGMNLASNEAQRDDLIDRDSRFLGDMRRPASTGVIGHQDGSSSSVLRSLGLDMDGSEEGAVRPAPKTLMDLIQEDPPTSPSPLYERGRQDSSPYNVHPSGSQHRPRVRDGSPASQYRHTESAAPRAVRVEPQHQVHHAQGSLDGITQSMDRLHVNTRPGYPREHPSTHVQYASQTTDTMGRELYQDHGGQRSIYVPAEQAYRSGPRTHHQPHQPAHHYESQPMYYDDRQPRNASLVAAAPAGMHPVYVNAPPPYGYQAVQYHSAPHHPQQQPRIMHHQPVQAGHPAHEYLPVVPIQAGSHGQLSGVPTQGTYAYWQQPEVSAPPAQRTSPPFTYTSAPGAPVAMARAPVSPVESAGGRQARHKGGAVRSPNERGKGRRAGRRGPESAAKHSPGGHAASSRLEEFRSTKNRDGWSVLDIRGHVVEFCQDQNGSRFIQQRLEIGDTAEKQIVLSEVLPDIHRLRNDVFGNYVVQKLFEFGTPEMQSDLRDTLRGEMLALSLQMYGCRVVQKALEALPEKDLPGLLVEFHHNVLSCIQDQNGNHVIQKCIEVMNTKAKMAQAAGDDKKAQFFSDQIDFIVDDVLNNVEGLSCHPYGCRVLQRILEHCLEPKKTHALNEISKCHRRLLDDQYGNYVIQHVLQYGRHSDRESILHIVVESGLLRLSRQKFASNVVEKLLKYGSPGQINAIVREMLKVVDENTGVPMDRMDGGSSVVLLMVRDAFANYVVQTTLDVVPEGEEKCLLLEELNAHSAELRNYTFAKHIVTKLGA